jgi:1,4-dihydroxy-2-naphthoate octaprenyltransferase
VAAWLQAIRAISLTATITPCVAVLLLGLHGGASPRWALAATALLGALLLQVGVNLMNDVEDHRRIIDVPGTLGGAGVIQRGWLRPAQVQRAARACLLVGALLGLPTALAEPRLMAGIAALALVGSLGYSGPRVGLKYRGLGDITVLLLCGPALTAGFAAAAFGVVPAEVLLLGGALGLYAVGILHVNNLQDVDADRASGAVTLAQRLGSVGSRVYLVALYGLGLGAWVVAALAAGLPVWLAIAPAALALVPTAALVREVLTGGDLQAPRYALLRIRAAQAHLLFGLLCIAALGVAIAL